MNRIELPVAVRLTAAALAVFVTVATLDGMLEVAGPDQALLHAQRDERGGASAAAAMPQHVAAAAQATAVH
jgi:hypothetical protein